MDKIYSIQSSLYTLYNFLPITTMITLLTLGVGLGNYGMITIGLTEFVLSVIIFCLHSILKFLKMLDSNQAFTFSMIPDTQSIQFISYWIVVITFLFAAIFTNAYRVHNIDPLKNIGSSDPNLVLEPSFQSKINNRKMRCKMIMVVSVVIGILFIGYRCIVEWKDFSLPSVFSSLLSIGLGGVAAFLWDLLLQQNSIGIGLGNMDIFGISQQLISVKQTDLATMCELQPAPKGTSGASCINNRDCTSNVCMTNKCT